MSERSTVIVNGVAYDIHTGLRLGKVAPQKTDKPEPGRPASHSLHRKTERTHTLSRAHVAVPPKQKNAAQKRINSSKGRSPMISHFTSDVVPASHAIKAAVKEPATLPPTHHARAGAEITHRPRQKSAHEIKEQAISKALEKSSAPEPKAKKHHARHRIRLASITSVATALFVLAGYLTYLNLPSISVRVAAAQAGIAAAYPSYQPSGYSLHGPVAYSNGHVTMQFVANAGPQNFSVNQEKSGWDSSVLLDSYIQPRSNGNYSTYTDSGLTIYVYGTSAAWLNGGILHTIEGDAPLTSEQIRHIATSM